MLGSIRSSHRALLWFDVTFDIEDVFVAVEYTISESSALLREGFIL